MTLDRVMQHAVLSCITHQPLSIELISLKSENFCQRTDRWTFINLLLVEPVNWTLAFKSIHTLLNTYQPVHCLRSENNRLLANPSVYTSTGRRAFNYAAPQIWNAIPLNIRNSPSVGSFKCTLETFLCCCCLLIFLNL